MMRLIKFRAWKPSIEDDVRSDGIGRVWLFDEQPANETLRQPAKPNGKTDCQNLAADLSGKTVNQIFNLLTSNS